MSLVLFQVAAVAVARRVDNGAVWEVLVVAAVTVAGFLTVAKLWFGRGQGDAPYGCRRRR